MMVRGTAFPPDVAIHIEEGQKDVGPAAAVTFDIVTELKGSLMSYKQSKTFDVHHSVVAWYDTIQYVSTFNQARHLMCIVLLLCDRVPSSTYPKSTKRDIQCASFCCCAMEYHHPVRVHNQRRETFNVCCPVVV